MLELAWLGLLIAVAAGTYLGVSLARGWALSRKVIAIPNARSSHSLPTPLGGGIAIIAINLAAWLALGLTHTFLTPTRSLVLIGAVLMIAVVSWLDDLGHVPAVIRLGSQTSSAVLVVVGCGYWQSMSLPLAGDLNLGGVGAVLTVLWIVGLTNAYNFMDGIDGMAAGQSSAAGIGYVGLGLLTGYNSLAGLGAILAATSIGFLVHNWHPASIFMGDVGSTFLGFTLAVIPLAAGRGDSRLPVAAALLVWPAIFDCTFTVVRRLRNHESILSGHRSFLFHRLVQAGWNHAAAAALYIPLPILGAVLACTWAAGTRPLHIFVVVGASASCLALWGLVRHQENMYVRGREEILTLSHEAALMAPEERIPVEV